MAKWLPWWHTPTVEVAVVNKDFPQDPQPPQTFDVGCSEGWETPHTHTQTQKLHPIKNTAMITHYGLHTPTSASPSTTSGSKLTVSLHSVTWSQQCSSDWCFGGSVTWLTEAHSSAPSLVSLCSGAPTGREGLEEGSSVLSATTGACSSEGVLKAGGSGGTVVSPNTSSSDMVPCEDANTWKCVQLSNSTVITVNN